MSLRIASKKTGILAKQRRADLYVVREKQTGRALAIVSAASAGEARARTACTLSVLLGISPETDHLKASWCRRRHVGPIPVFPERFFQSSHHSLPRLPGDRIRH